MDNNPFGPAKELRAKKHKSVDSPVKSNKKVEEWKGSEDSNALPKHDQMRRGSKPTSTDRKNIPPPYVAASQTSQSPNTSFNLKGANVFKAPEVAPKRNFFQAKVPVQNSVDRKPESRGPVTEDQRPRYDDRRPYDRGSDPDLRDNYYRDNYYRDSRYDIRNLRDRRDYRPDPKFDRYDTASALKSALELDALMREGKGSSVQELEERLRHLRESRATHTMAELDLTNLHSARLVEAQCLSLQDSSISAIKG